MASLQQDGLKCELQVEIPVDVVNQARKEKLNKMKKDIQMNGFRANQVPDFLIEKRYGKRLTHDVMEELISSSIQETFKEKKIIPASTPKREDEQLELGKPIKVKLVFESLPQIELKPIKDLKIEKPNAVVDAKAIKKNIDELVDQFPKWSSVKREAKKGDRVQLEYTAKIGKELFKNGDKTSLNGILGEHHIFEALEKKLIGLDAKKAHKISIKMKDDFADIPEMAGKKVDFEVTINEIEESKKSKYDDTFIEQIIGEKQTKKEFEAMIEKNLKKQYDSLVKQIAYQRLEKSVSKAYSFELPESILENEIKARASKLEEKEKEKLLKKGVKGKDPVITAAKDSVRIALLAAKVSEEESIVVSENELADYILSFSRNQEDVQGFFKWFIEDKERVLETRNQLMHQKAMDFMLDQIPLEKETSTFEQLQALAKESQNEPKKK
ncbi:MAG: trigger factor [Legionellales bacterium]|mgnify:CR=1 FL=1|nr:trigger factor [Legionellales bacterium]OUX65651.1 MAG: trigger factor [Gammaproteobacteria bacterium TMED281]